MGTSVKTKGHNAKTSSPLLARLTGRNLLVIPEKVVRSFPGIDTFEVTVENGKLVLVPLDLPSADEIRQDLAARGISEEDVAEAVEWARGRGKQIGH